MQTIRLFEAFAGYGSQLMAMRRLEQAFPDKIKVEPIGISEIDKITPPKPTPPQQITPRKIVSLLTKIVSKPNTSISEIVLFLRPNMNHSVLSIRE